MKDSCTLPGCRKKSIHFSGGLRFAATTGYYLSALQAETTLRQVRHSNLIANLRYKLLTCVTMEFEV